jgi:hypothetical protein
MVRIVKHFAHARDGHALRTEINAYDIVERDIIESNLRDFFSLVRIA